MKSYHINYLAHNSSRTLKQHLPHNTRTAAFSRLSLLAHCITHHHSATACLTPAHSLPIAPRLCARTLTLNAYHCIKQRQHRRARKRRRRRRQQNIVWRHEGVNGKPSWRIADGASWLAASGSNHGGVSRGEMKKAKRRRHHHQNIKQYRTAAAPAREEIMTSGGAAKNVSISKYR